MAVYTVAELKDRTSVPSVANWSDDKILLYQSMAESIIDGLNPDTTMNGYGTAYDSSVVFVFDWLAENPTGKRAQSKGKVSQQFSFDDLPFGAQAAMRVYVNGSTGFMSGATFSRKDIGRR